MIDSVDRQIIRRVQQGVPLASSPYSIIAADIGIAEEELLARLRHMKERGMLRKMGAVLQHHKAGFHGNALCCWQIPLERIGAVSEKMSACKYISHVYLRKPHEKWPYNLYTVFHSQTREACLALVEEMAASIGVSAYQVLFSRKNWKRSRLPLLQEQEDGVQ